MIPYHGGEEGSNIVIFLYVYDSLSLDKEHRDANATARRKLAKRALHVGDVLLLLLK